MANPPAPRPGTKQALVVDALSQPQGVSIRDLADLTGWRLNTVHSTLTTLRATGWTVTGEEVGGERRYSIPAARG